MAMTLPAALTEGARLYRTHKIPVILGRYYREAYYHVFLMDASEKYVDITCCGVLSCENGWRLNKPCIPDEHHELLPACLDAIDDTWGFMREQRVSIVSNGMLLSILVSDHNAVELARSYWNAMSHFIRNHQEAVLVPFRDREIVCARGNSHPFEIDPNELLRLADDDNASYCEEANEYYVGVDK